MHLFSFPTSIHFGVGSRSAIVSYLKSQGVGRPLVVTDRGVASLGFCREMQAGLTQAGLETDIFSEVWGNPVKSQVIAGVLAYRDHQADAIIGLGGGAAIDVAKAIALMVNHPGDLFDYEDGKDGARPIDKPIPCWVAVPTTSGTGSEVGRSTVISDDKTHLKKIIFSPKLLARAVFADPELTVGLPSNVTAATGMDALTHCVEAFLALGYHPICDGIALEGLRLAGQSLRSAVKEPGNMEARSSMMMASMMGAIAFQKGLGVTHSCAHALGTVMDMHHGLANGVMIDFALGFNLSVVADRFVRMARTLELADNTAAGFLRWLSELKTETGIPKNLTALGVGHHHLAQLVEVATRDGCHQNNPRSVSKKDFEAIFSQALA